MLTQPTVNTVKHSFNICFPINVSQALVSLCQAFEEAYCMFEKVTH